ncbi:MAG: 1,4-alpha-glucan branching protein GlgB [Erysipelotrichaceae bacterium]|nr:1,4-alpha-glucan branching protein GlgB [Erysipelotrichaceae bacterium]
MQEVFKTFFEGTCLNAYDLFGMHKEGDGIRFTVYAPNAYAVYLVGDFNHWNNHRMDKIDRRGIYSTVIHNAKEYDNYKYRIETQEHVFLDKADPYAVFSEVRPKTASKVYNIEGFNWSDKVYLNKRNRQFDKPMNIYELHLGSWKRKKDVVRTEDPDDPDVTATYHTYEEMIDILIPYITKMGYSHIELLPLAEHPFDGSWGYQDTGYYSATSRYGTPRQLMKLINACHKAGIGVIMDFVPVHFVQDAHGLAMFDGGCVYEYYNEYDRYSEWGTSNFDLWRESVRSFLMSAVNFWIEVYHVDGIRFDAVSNVIYWRGKKDLGINGGAVDFIRRVNTMIHEKHPEIMMIAEDSSDYQGVTKAVEEGGLGFDYKWDLGWMNDTLRYYSMDPYFRGKHHHMLTFSILYFFSENFIMPFSHDEVVHGKKTIVDKMWGTYEQKFAQARNLYLYMMTHPGKKLNFMGNELGMLMEWSEKKSCDWNLLEYPKHQAFHRYIKDLNMIYRYHKAFHVLDYSYDGFEWIDADNTTQSIYVYERKYKRDHFVVVLNMTPLSYETYRVGVPREGIYMELINSEKDIYEGCNMCNYEPVESEAIPAHHRNHSIKIRVAPFSGIIFQYMPSSKKNKE